MLTPVDGPNRTPSAEPPLPVKQPAIDRVAVMLNRNARKVTDRLAKRMERVVGSDHVFYSRSLEEAEALTREIVQRGYGTVVCGGGDGTLANTLNLVQRYVRESNDWRRERFQRYGEKQSLLTPPRFGFLRLGTGNGFAPVVGAGDPLRDLKRLVEYGPGRTHELPLVESRGERFFFGGMGFDSMLLNDYNALKARTHNPIFKPIMHSVSGYFAALFARTLPRILFSRSTKIDARVVTRGRAFYVDPRRGDASIEIDPGSTLFEGDATIIAAGTTPFYGYGFRIFPFANIMPGMMHLRVATISAAGTLSRLPSIWRGRYRNPRRIMDFLVEDVNVELGSPYPFQHSGDAQGLRTSLDLKTAPEPLRLVDYYPARPVG